MSKRTSKILVVAVVAILAISMISLVACGPKALDPKTAMTTLQEGFNEATEKSVHEVITLGGLNVSIALAGTELANVGVTSATIDLTRKYTEGNLNIDATVKDVKVTLSEATKTLLGTFVDTVNWETIETAVAGVTLEANVDINTETLVVKTNKLMAKGLNNIVSTLDAAFDIKAKLPSAEIDPRHEGDGMFTQLDEYTEGVAGVALENFLKGNISMLSLYDFGEVKVEKDKLSYDNTTNLSKIYGIAQEVLDAYKNVGIYNGVDGNFKEDDGTDLTVGKLVNKVFSTTDVEAVIANIVDMGNVKMNAELVADGKVYKLAKMTSEQTLDVHLTAATLNNVVTKLLPIFNVDLIALGVPQNLLDAVLGAGISSPIKAKTVAEFTY